MALASPPSFGSAKVRRLLLSASFSENFLKNFLAFSALTASVRRFVLGLQRYGFRINPASLLWPFLVTGDFSAAFTVRRFRNGPQRYEDFSALQHLPEKLFYQECASAVGADAYDADWQCRSILYKLGVCL